MLDNLIMWLALPISGTADHLIAPVVSWHGRIMVAAWGLAVPVAVLLARFFKVKPNQAWPDELDTKFWWYGHQLLNYSAVAATCGAAALVWRQGDYSGTVRELHSWMGWSIVALGLLQMLGGQLRGSKGGPTAPRIAADGSVLDYHGDHYDMTRRRLVFEYVHKALGYSALLLSATTIVLGMWAADAPRWMWGGLGLWWCVLLVLFARLQSSGRCLDTYQAIWGPDPVHPGSAVPPVGWGIRRVTASEATGRSNSNGVTSP